MAKRLNLEAIIARNEHEREQKQQENKKPVEKKSRFLDTKHNIDYKIRQAFSILPGALEAKELQLEETKHLAHKHRKDWQEKDYDLAKKSRLKFLDTTDTIRQENSKYLADAITFMVPNKIDEQKGNQEYLRCFKVWLNKIGKAYEKKENRHISTEKKNDKAFNLLSRSFGEKLATHINPDLDGLACELILKLCNFTPWMKNSEQIGHKDLKQGYLHLDTAGENGAYIEGPSNDKEILFLGSFFNATAVLDHHNSKLIDGEVYHGASSATQMVFTMLHAMDKIPPELFEQISRFVNFVNTIDSAGIEVIGRDFDYSHRTLMGLQKLLLKNPKNTLFVYQYFANPNHGGLEILTDEQLDYIPTEQEIVENNKKAPGERQAYVYNIKGDITSLRTLSDSKKFANAQGNKVAERLLDAGMYLESPLNQESFIVDLHNELINPAEIANYNGCGLIKVQPDGKIFIYSPRHMDLDDKTWATFGDYTRGHILFVDVTKVQDWSRFEKILFNHPNNERVLGLLRDKIKRKRADIKENIKKKEEGGQVKNIIYGAINKFVASKPALHISDIQVGKEYEVIVNNVERRGAFVTFGSNTDAQSIGGKDSYINGLIHKSQLHEGVESYSQKVGQTIRVQVMGVKQNDNGTYAIDLKPSVANIQTKQEDKTQTA